MYEKKSNGIIDDPLPKSEPIVENSREFDMNDSLGDIYDSPFKKKEENHAIGENYINLQNELNRIMGKLSDSQDLAEMYKAELSRVQSNYLKIAEEQNALLMKLNAVIGFNRDLERLLDDNKDFMKQLEDEKNIISKEFAASQRHNNILQTSLAELQNANDLLEKEHMKSQKYIENIENANILLVASNQTLRFELDKSKTNEKGLHLNLKSLKGLINPMIVATSPLNTIQNKTNDYSISDSDTEKINENDEEDKTYKNIPNVSNKFNGRIPSKMEYDNINILESIDMSKPIKIMECKRSLRSCDNLAYFLKAIRGNEGIIYEEFKFQIGYKITVERKEY